MAATAAEGSRSSVSADTYIGSLISLTSKSEMRYEGVLYNINTDESSIGLRNVRSFGTEGRKKDGPQVSPSDKVYEYILFRGSDIKDLQVKSSPSAHASLPINNDPAIIQSHYSRPPPPISSSFPSTVGGLTTGVGSNTSQSGLPGSNFQGGLPLYQPGTNVGPWGLSPSPQNTAGGGLPMPMYWQGYNFPPPNGLPQLPHQSLLRPPPGLPMPPLQQPFLYAGLNPPLPIGTSNLPVPNLPENPFPQPPSTTSSFNLAPTSSPALASQSNLRPVPSIAVASENLQSLIPNSSSVPILSAPPLSANLTAFSHLAASSTVPNPLVQPVTDKDNETSFSTFSYSMISQAISSIVEGSNATLTETSTPSLVTPGQLLQPAPAAVSAPQPPEAAHKDVEVVKVASPSLEPSKPAAVEAQPPLLPLPQPSRGSAHKLNGTPFQGRPAYRGHGRGRGPGLSRPVTKFTEEFDFTAMNEKFNKDEVWGHLGKSNRSRKEGDEGSDEDDYEDEDYTEAAKVEVKPVYNKDDFFDSISSNALDRESNHGRMRFSEQRKIDTETFGDFSRYRGGRGGHWHGRGGRYRGSYRGRGYGGGYSGRGGGGRGIPNRDS